MTIVRICIGIYALSLLVRIFGHANVLYSTEGVVGENVFRYTAMFFPFDISHLFTSLNVQILFLTAICSSLLFICGYFVRTTSFYILIVFFLLHYRNPYSLGFYTQFMGWTFALFLLWPSIDKKSLLSLQYRQQLIIGAQIILGLSYLSSGLAKLSRIEWRTGEALLYFIDLPFLRNVNWITEAPLFLIRLGTWGSLFIEIAFLPLFFIKKTKFTAWVVATLFQFIILITFDIPYVTLVILIFHILAMEQSWFDCARGKLKNSKVASWL